MCGLLKTAGGATLVFETELVEVVGKSASQVDSEL